MSVLPQRIESVEYYRDWVYIAKKSDDKEA